MRAIQHPTCTRVLGAPKGWNQHDVECRALPIAEVAIGHLMAMRSFWKPNAAELAALNAGGCVALSIIMDVHPPVAMEVMP